MKFQKSLKYSIKFLSIILILFLSLNNTFAGRKISLEELKFDLNKINHNNLGIIVWDQRDQIIDHSQPESFLGYIRSITAIAWPYFEKNEQNLSELIAKKIQESYMNSGLHTNLIPVSPFDTEEKILNKINNYKYNKVLVIKFNDLHFDGVAKIAYIVDIDILLYDTNGNKIIDKKVVDKIVIGSSSKHKKTVPSTLKTIFENILNNNDLVSEINKKASKNNLNENISNYDLIITKDGEEVQAKVIEITDNKIKYKLFNNLEGPLRIIDKSEIFMIKYKDGFKEVFNK